MSTIINPKNTPADLLDDLQVAAILGVQPRSVRQWRSQRGLPFLRITPKTIRFRRSDLDAWLDRSRVQITGGAR